MDKSFVRHPLISEKATVMSAIGKYMFLVSMDATAPEVKKIIESHYKVHIRNMNMIIVKPKKRRLGRSVGVKPGYKKVIVTLKAGEKLDVLPHS